MKMLYFLFFALVLAARACAVQAQNVPTITAPDPDRNALRVNGLIELDVYASAPQHLASGMEYEVICTIAPLARFEVHERSDLYGMIRWRHVNSVDGTCNGWAKLP